MKKFRFKKFKTIEQDKSDYRKVCEALANNKLHLDGKYTIDKLDRFQLGILIDKCPWKITSIKNPPYDLIEAAIRKDTLQISNFPYIKDEVLLKFIIDDRPYNARYIQNLPEKLINYAVNKDFRLIEIFPRITDKRLQMQIVKNNPERIKFINSPSTAVQHYIYNKYPQYASLIQNKITELKVFDRLES